MQGPFDNSGKFNLQLSQQSADQTNLAAFRRPSGRTWPLGLQVKSAENARTIRQKGLRPPAGTPRQQISVFYCILQLKLASGLNNPSKIKGSSRPFQGLQHGPAAALSCTLDLILQTSPAGPLQGRFGGPTWPILGLNWPFCRPQARPGGGGVTSVSGPCHKRAAAVTRRVSLTRRANSRLD